MRRNLTYPKDGDHKLREAVKDLKAQVARLRKENSMLRQELMNVVKPIRTKREKEVDKSDEPPKMMTREEWRKKFVQEMRPVIEKRLEGIKKDESEEN